MNNTLEKFKFDDYSPQLADGVELIYGANSIPLLYNNKSQKYVRISPVGIDVINLLDGEKTIKEISNIIAGEYKEDPSRVEQIVYQFFYSLQQANVLDISPEPVEENKIFNRLVRKRPILRFPLVKSVNLITNPFNLLTKKLSSKSVLFFYILGFLVALSFVSYFLYANSSFQPNLQSVSWLTVIFLYIFHICIHELGHAVALKRFGLEIREAGVGLLYYFIPIAYVDTTDIYRLNSKLDRIIVAAIGPLVDIGGAAISCLIITSQIGPQTEFQLLFILQLSFFIFNLNPLLPTDGFHVVEAALGELNLRRRSFEYLYFSTTKKEIPMYLKNVNHKTKKGYLIYGSFSMLYISAIIIMLLLVIITSFA